MHGYEKVLERLDRRIAILQNHQGPTEKIYDNEYAELMDAVARVVGTALLKELTDLRQLVADAAQGKL